LTVVPFYTLLEREDASDIKGQVSATQAAAEEITRCFHNVPWQEAESVASFGNLIYLSIERKIER
jgi:hypothetical protein